MTRLRYRIVDVFTERPLLGNALCVVLDPCPPELMAPIAREVNLSETTFPTITAEDAYDVRIFTPTSELPFAGHPTLGTAWVLGPRRWSQTSSGATLAVEADGAGATMTQPPPTLTEVDATGPCRAAGVAGSAWVGEAAGMRHLMVATEAPIETIRPDLAVVAAAAEVEACTTFAVVRRRSDRELHVRVFVPGAGIAEDPGTGSAAGPIAVLAHEAWGTEPCMTIRQGAEIGRPCMLEVDVRGPAPVVGGRVVACAEGVFTV